MMMLLWPFGGLTAMAILVVTAFTTLEGGPHWIPVAALMFALAF
jgi:hypothetical protein